MHNTSKWLIALVVALVIINISLLAFTWLSKDDKHERTEGPGDAKTFLVSALQLNANQVAQFDSLRKKHFEQVNRQRQEMRKLKDELFAQLKEENSNAGEAAERIGALQTSIELNTFQHFAALRKICTEQQKKKFDDTIQDVLRSMGRRDRQGPPPGDGPPLGRGNDPPPPEGPPHS